MKIRPTTDSDAEAVARLWTEGYTGAGPGGRSTPYGPAEFLAVARHGRPFVAIEGEEPVGVVVVARAARGRALALALSELCTELAREAGAEGIVLWSRPYQVEGHRLYESLGYRRRPERDDEDADGLRLVLRLDLGQQKDPRERALLQRWESPTNA